MLDWFKQHKNDAIFTTNEGIMLKEHLGGMIKEEALAMLQLGKIELLYALELPDIFISEETYNAFKEVLKES